MNVQQEKEKSYSGTVLGIFVGGILTTGILCSVFTFCKKRQVIVSNDLSETSLQVLTSLNELLYQIDLLVWALYLFPFILILLFIFVFCVAEKKSSKRMQLLSEGFRKIDEKYKKIIPENNDSKTIFNNGVSSNETLAKKQS